MSEDRVATGFMCRTDWDYEIGAALGGNTIYPSVEDLRRNRACTDSCWIVEVEIKLARVVSLGTDP